MENEAGNIVETYLEMMDQQREQLFADLDGINEEDIWQPPAEKEWSIGENLDHLRVINSSTLTLFKITGRIRADEIQTWQAKHYAGVVTSLHLWDLTEADLSDISLMDINEDIKRTKQLVRARAGGKTAFVTHKDLEFGISRMSEAHNEIEKMSIQYKAFRNIEEARAWLGV